MQIVITAEGTSLDSPVDPRFGRARYFLLMDSEAGSFTVHDNAQNLNAAQGAGIQAAQTVVRLGAKAVLTGNVGPKALAVLQAGKVAVCPGAAGTVGEALEQFRAGRLQPTDKATVQGHWS